MRFLWEKGDIVVFKMNISLTLGVFVTLENYVISQIKKAVDSRHGLQSEISRQLGLKRGTVSNRLTGKRKSDESFRRSAADIAGLNYDSIVARYYKDHSESSKINTGDQTAVNSPGAIQAHGFVVSEDLSRENISSEDGELVELLLKYGNKKIKSDLRAVLEKIRNISI